MMTAKITRRSALVAAASSLAGTAFAQQQYPNRPIRILIGFAPGGGTDVITRVYAAKLADVLKVPVIVENKPGAQELLAAQPVMAAPADGYTLWVATSSALGITPALRSDLPYDPLKNFTPISRIGEIDAVFCVRNGIPVDSMPEFIKYAKANRGKLNYASAGIGAVNHVVPEYIKSLLGLHLVHIPYKGDSDVVRELTAGSVDFALVGSGLAVPFATSGRFKPIGVMGTSRLKALPNVPSMSEGVVPELKNLGIYAYFGMLGPAGLPPAVVHTLNEAMTSIAAMPDVVQKIDAAFLRTASSTPAELRQRIEGDLARWREVGRSAKLQLSNT